MCVASGHGGSDEWEKYKGVAVVQIRARAQGRVCMGLRLYVRLLMIS